jgi:hypothetical protein
MSRPATKDDLRAALHISPLRFVLMLVIMTFGLLVAVTLMQAPT